MEEEKKKKRNKKKKNKQTKTTEDVVVGVGETATLDQNHVVGQDHDSQVSVTADVNNDDVKNTDVGLNRHRIDGTEASILAEAKKPYWLDREAGLEETVKQLQNENDSHIQKEARLEETVKQLQNENDSHIQKEAGLAMKIIQLQHENDFWLRKEAGLEEKITQLLDEKAALSSKGASSEEKVKHLERERGSWVLKENLTKETIASLNDDNTRLRLQVMELEESWNNLFQENQQLIENISRLQSQIQNLERSTSPVHLSTESTKHSSENEDLNPQMEAARALVEKLITENAELVEKVNELYIELDRRSVTIGLSSAIGSDPMVGTAETAGVADPVSDSGERMFVSGESMESLEAVPIKHERISNDNVDTEYTTVIPNFSETSESGEIVQIPLDENEVPDLELQATASDEKVVLPLSDAPLIGAPFRLISFVAKYVSGADLVDKRSLNSGQ